MAERRKSYEHLSAAVGVASKAIGPVAAGAAGAAIAGVGLRFLVARYSPTAYAKAWVPYVLGAVGAVLGGFAAAAPLVTWKTKAGREKGYKATLPLATLGLGFVLAMLSFGGRALNWFRSRFPNAANALSPGSAIPALPPPPTSSGATRELTSLRTVNPTMFRAAGLSPAQWARLEGRKQELTSGRAGGRSRSRRWAA